MKAAGSPGQQTSRRRNLLLALLGIALVAGAAGGFFLVRPTPKAASKAPSKVIPGSSGAPILTNRPTPIFDVTKFGAVGDGKTDSTAAIHAATAKAQQGGGGTVYFPPGHYVCSSTSVAGACVQVDGTVAIWISGDSRDSTKITQIVPARQAVAIHTDGVVVDGLTLDTQSSNAKAAIVVVANHTTLQRSRVLGSQRAFALYYVGPQGADKTNPTYNVGNRVLDTVVNDQITDDGFSFSFQQNGLIQGIQHTGSRLALYIDKSVSVIDYHYTPGSQPSAKDGFWITPPSTGVVVTRFVSDGAGGIIGASPTPGRFSTDIQIIQEQLLGPSGYHLTVGDVRNLVIDGCKFNPGNALVFHPRILADNVVVRNSVIPLVQYTHPPTAKVTNVTFENDTPSWPSIKSA